MNTHTKTPTSRAWREALAFLLLTAGGFIVIIGILLLCGGCALMPKADRALFNITTNYAPVVLTVTNTQVITNIVERPVVTREVVVVTNIIQAAPVVTTTVIEHTNIVRVPEIVWSNTVQIVTNFIPHDVVVAPKAAIGTSLDVVGGLAGPWGTLGAVALTAILGVWARSRQKDINAVLAGEVAAKQTVGETLSQSIEVARELIKKTPQGQQLEQRYLDWLQTHQAAQGVLGAVADLVTETVSNPQAKVVADLISPRPTV